MFAGSVENQYLVGEIAPELTGYGLPLSNPRVSVLITASALMTPSF
jgi:hypothetical protein